MSLKCHLVVQVKCNQEGRFISSDFKNMAPFLTAHSGMGLKQCPRLKKKKKGISPWHTIFWHKDTRIQRQVKKAVQYGAHWYQWADDDAHLFPTPPPITLGGSIYSTDISKDYKLELFSFSGEKIYQHTSEWYLQNLLSRARYSQRSPGERNPLSCSPWQAYFPLPHLEGEVLV